MKFKRGDTFAFSMYLRDDNGEAVVVTVDNIKCQVRTISGDLVDTLTTEATDNPGEYLFKSPSTNDYPLGKLEMDVRVIKDDIVGSTPTIVLDIERDVTRDGE